MEAAVQATCSVYISGLERVSKQHDMTFLVLSICPPCNPQYSTRVQATRLFNKALKEALGHRFIDIATEIVTPIGVVKSEYACDGTHLGGGAIPLIEAGLNSALQKTGLSIA
eukprot:CAMPEP_0173385588 /NCGR_PEP_ID=MMETSP1356-20130122/8199_1 /TAXON_ID=77927 ORGANISM="Hemiselmis virescens, Strain PCC157" /NCGR_SAMPLE_ID=MMETSP1356 /ASSEMBLY_ACC=CAM_ASM_000847 /LENGTH=111 /DNA_ID=CAMNT_0014341461 /DNA_START=84 /DNA_END=419 /DNA_ORIENTATION=-